MSKAQKINDFIEKFAIIGGTFMAVRAIHAAVIRKADEDYYRELHANEDAAEADAEPASGVGAARKYYVYAGYYENYISSKPMPRPYILRRTFRSIDRAINYANSFGDYVVFCDNVKNDLPDYLYEALLKEDYFNL